MDASKFFEQDEPDFDSDTTEIITLPLVHPELAPRLETVTLVSPGATVHNVIRGSYVYRVMIANGYKVVQS